MLLKSQRYYLQNETPQALLDHRSRVPRRSRGPRKSGVPRRGGVPWKGRVPRRSGVPWRSRVPRRSGVSWRSGISRRSRVPREEQGPLERRRARRSGMCPGGAGPQEDQDLVPDELQVSRTWVPRGLHALLGPDL